MRVPRIPRFQPYSRYLDGASDQSYRWLSAQPVIVRILSPVLGKDSRSPAVQPYTTWSKTP
jgi:hypothetical protein